MQKMATILTDDSYMSTIIKVKLKLESRINSEWREVPNSE